MRIAVFGATGSVGAATVTEALARGHHVTAIVRTPRPLPPDWSNLGADVRGADVRGAVGDVRGAVGRGAIVRPAVGDVRPEVGRSAMVEARVGDATNPADVLAVADHDVVIGATRPPQGHEDALLHATETLLATLAGTNVRLLLIGGAATLRIPGTTRTVLQSPLVHDSFRGIAEACASQHARCLTESRTDWTYVSPPASLIPGPRTGRYRLGADELVVDPAGDSTISIADLAVAVLDEVERPKHTRCRFTVGY